MTRRSQEEEEEEEEEEEKKGSTGAALGTAAAAGAAEVVANRRSELATGADSDDARAGAGADAAAFWQELSATLQTAVAEHILSAHRPAAPPGRR